MLDSHLQEYTILGLPCSWLEFRQFAKWSQVTSKDNILPLLLFEWNEWHKFGTVISFNRTVNLLLELELERVVASDCLSASDLATTPVGVCFPLLLWPYQLVTSSYCCLDFCCQSGLIYYPGKILLFYWISNIILSFILI